MGDFERHNQRAIDSLNQRGGRMLSLVDLVAANTVDLDLAAALAFTAARGGSFLTAAGPGGVGKTTLMGAMLAFCAPGVEIVTVEGASWLARRTASPADHPECLVVHEIGSGAYYGYLWGPAVADYVAAAAEPARCVASNLHAETYDEAVAQLIQPPLGVARAVLSRVAVLAFLSASRGRRRVTEVRVAEPGGGHGPAWRWLDGADRFERLGRSAPARLAAALGLDAAAAGDDLARFRDFLRRAQEVRCLRMEDLRRRALAEVF